MAVYVLVIDTIFVMQNCVEAQIVKIGRLLHRGEVLAVLRPQCERRPTQSEHLFPVKRKRMTILLRLHHDLLVAQISAAVAAGRIYRQRQV